MGRKGNWFSAMKKALNPEAKEQQITQESGKSKKKWFRKKRRAHSNTKASSESAPSTTMPAPQPTAVALVAPAPEPAKEIIIATDKEHIKHAYTVALATTKAAEAAVVAAQTAAEVIRLTANASPPFVGKSKEEVAAIKIQTAFRGYMARRMLRALRGLMRLKNMMQGQVAKRQTANTLKSMQILARVQSQMHERRQRMAEENFARQKQMHQKYAKEQANKYLEKTHQNGDDWDSSIKTKEQIEAKLQSRHEAAIRRERTLAYAFTHQQAWKATSMSTHMFMDGNNPHWGWSWLERWLAARPWEIATPPDKDFSNESSPRVKTSSMSNFAGNSNKHGLTKACNNARNNQPRSSTNGRLSTSVVVPSKPNLSTARKMRSPSPMVSPKAAPRMSMWGQEDDAISTQSMQSEHSGMHSVTCSSIRDDDSQGSSPTLPSYMAPTEAAKARSRLGGQCKRDKSVTPDRVSVSSARGRRASQPASPARSRRSASSTADANSTPERP